MALKDFLSDIKKASIDRNGREILSPEAAERVVSIAKAMYKKGMIAPELRASKFDYMDQGCVFDFIFRCGVVKVTQLASGKILEEAWVSCYDAKNDVVLDRKFTNNLTKTDLDIFMTVNEVGEGMYDEYEYEADDFEF